MTFGSAAAFFLVLAAIACGAVAAKAWQSGVDTNGALALVVGAAAVTQAVAAAVMMRGLKHAADQADAAVRAVEAAQLSSERQLRAYVDCVGAALEESLSVDSGFCAKVVIRNMGQTPASNVRIRITLNITPVHPVDAPVLKEMFDDISLPETARSDGSLGAGVEATISFRKPLEEVYDLLPQLKAGTRKMLIKGRVDYVDAFGKTRWSNFTRWLANPEEERLITGPTGTNEWS